MARSGPDRFVTRSGAQRNHRRQEYLEEREEPGARAGDVKGSHGTEAAARGSAAVGIVVEGQLEVPVGALERVDGEARAWKHSSACRKDARRPRTTLPMEWM